MTFLRRRRLGAVLATLALCGLPQVQVQAQTFPTKPVRIVIPFAPGGSTDANARIIQDKLSTLWGQPVIVDAKPGANTVIGTDLVAKSPGDGHTLLLTSTAMEVNPSMYAKLPCAPPPRSTLVFPTPAPCSQATSSTCWPKPTCSPSVTRGPVH